MGSQSSSELILPATLVTWEMGLTAISRCLEFGGVTVGLGLGPWQGRSPSERCQVSWGSGPGVSTVVSACPLSCTDVVFELDLAKSPQQGYCYGQSDGL